MKDPSFSVVVNTYNRADSLAVTLTALEFLDHPNFEVIVVNGPSTDRTVELLDSYRGRIKRVSCPSRNLSASRNLGIRAAAGEIVAFIDDDAYPDPAWLDCLADAYRWEEVAAAGGPVFGPSGYYYQCLYSRADRFGNFWTDYPPSENPTIVLASPGTAMFTYTIGTNSSFRRDRLVQIGGFDEEFEYYLDETDLCCRLTDAGWVVAAVDEGFVYHKFLKSGIRSEDYVIRDWYQVLKSRFYYGMKHGLPHASFAEVCAQQAKFVEGIRANVELNVEAGVHDPAVASKFEADVRAASDLGLERWREGHTKERPPSWFDEEPREFLPFPTRRAKREKLHVCFLSQEYPPVPVNGIGRVVHTLARALADRGHVVRVLTRGEGGIQVDLEDGVWVHRVPDQIHPLPGDPELPPVPTHIWNHAASLLEELRRIEGIRPVDVVQTPNWDSEGLAALADGSFRVVVGLYTPLRTVVFVDPRMQAEVASGDPMLPQLMELERHMYRKADGFLACGPAIVEEIERTYDVRLPEERTGLVPHGLDDVAATHPPLPRDPKRRVPCLLFVGRLEPRKGADLLIESVGLLRQRGVELALVLAGDDSLLGENGLTLRQELARRRPDLLENVEFLGRIDDEELWRLYRSADVFVAPSRFESFGLMVVEAMMFEVPVVVSDIGGMREIVETTGAGLLVPPGDPVALADALESLLADPKARAEMGRLGRARFELAYNAGVMAEGAEAFYRRIVALPRREEARSAEDGQRAMVGTSPAAGPP